MFIQCSVCDYKYIVNSADLKPDGRMVECANCNHRWYQEPLKAEELLSPSLPSTSAESIDTQEHKKNDEKQVWKSCEYNFSCWPHRESWSIKLCSVQSRHYWHVQKSGS